jgi:hypothetical protein
MTEPKTTHHRLWNNFTPAVPQDAALLLPAALDEDFQ